MPTGSSMQVSNFRIRSCLPDSDQRSPARIMCLCTLAHWTHSFRCWSSTLPPHSTPLTPPQASGRSTTLQLLGEPLLVPGMRHLHMMDPLEGKVGPWREEEWRGRGALQGMLWPEQMEGGHGVPQHAWAWHSLDGWEGGKKGRKVVMEEGGISSCNIF